jgi:DNA-binding MarR family transcriptional regulator
MERDNLINRVRNNDDRRIYNFFLTEKAKRACRKLEDHANAMHKLATLNIAKKDIEKLNKTVTNIISNLQGFLKKD